MSDTPAFQREHYGAGEQQSAGWPFHCDYGVEHPPDEGAEAELTAGFRVEPGREYGFLTDTTLCIGRVLYVEVAMEWPSGALLFAGAVMLPLESLAVAHFGLLFRRLQVNALPSWMLTFGSPTIADRLLAMAPWARPM